MKLLTLAYYYPPQTSVGTLRTLRFMKAWVANGHQADVICADSPDRQFHPAGGLTDSGCAPGLTRFSVAPMNIKPAWQWPTRLIKGVRRLLGLRPIEDGRIARHFWFIDLEWGWILPAYQQACECIRQSRPDAIYVSCPPFSAAVVGYLLKRRFGLPLVLDFRDGWGGSGYHGSQASHGWEQRLVSMADRLIVTSPSDQAYYQALSNTPVSLIYNGYDAPFDRPYLAHVGDPTLTLTYLGGWDGFRRSPEALLRALKQCDFPWRLVSAGNTNQALVAWASTLGLSDQVLAQGALPKGQLGPLLAQSDLLFINKGQPEPGQRDTHVAAKILDYLACGKPILAELPFGDSQEVLRQYAKSLTEVSAGKPDDYVAALKTLYQLKRRGELHGQAPDDEFLARFSPQYLGQQFCEVMTGQGLPLSESLVVKAV
ncbi:glycosyltransferase [Marinobacter hydrocarbonoclasticus]|nr:glycosyltransferase [Marinobacter nauticus]